MSRSKSANGIILPTPHTETTEAPPALASPPQFDPKYWAKVPRGMIRAEIQRVTRKVTREGEYSEIVLKGGMAFMRKTSDITQLLTANLPIEVEHIMQGKIVTGLFVPGVGAWAFRLSNEDIADHVKKLAAHEHEQAAVARQQVTELVSAKMKELLTILLGGVKPDALETLDLDEYAQLFGEAAVSAIEEVLR